MVSVSFEAGRFQNGVASSRWNFLRTVEIYANQARMASLVVALKIGLPQFAARFQPAPLWLEERIREALVEPAEPVALAQFDRTMKAIADGR